MNRLARVIFENRLIAWLVFAGAVLLAAFAATDVVRDMSEKERLSLLQTDASRRAVELMSQTLNGNLMGSVSLLGLIDAEIKREALGQTSANNPRTTQILESVGRSHDADGVFLVAANGVVGSSWDNSGKPSTGLNVKFRPYYQMGMQGMNNVYAAVSLARGDRSLYFASPIFIDTTNGTDAIGVVVARTGLLKVDDLLRDKADIAVLLSPQGVVFASSRKEWIGRLAGAPTPERLKAIRELKQFGNMFESGEPLPLPVSMDAAVQRADGQRFALARASVPWNDPFGDWTLVLMEDLERSVPMSQRFGVGVGTALLLFLLGTMLLKVLQSHHQQALAADELANMAHSQQLEARHKEEIAAAALQLQYAKTTDELTRTFLSEMHRMFNALHGVVYCVDQAQPGMLKLAGMYACAEPPPECLAFGERLLGQCAIERLPVLVTDLPVGMGDIHSGLGSSSPRALLIAPVLLKDELMGVVELALLAVPEERAKARLLEMTGLLGMNLEIVGRTMATQENLSVVVAAEHAKAEQLFFQQALIDTIPYPVFYKGADTRFLGVNRAYEETFQIRRADLIGKRVLDLEYLPEADRLAYQAEDERTIDQIATVQREMTIPFADGKVHDTLYFVSGFQLAQGQPGGLVGTFIDITKIKTAERELERMSDIERLNCVALGREMRVLELKKEINGLVEAAGGKPPYAISLIETTGDHEADPNPDYRTTLDHGGASLKLADLVDIDELQQLFASFCESVGIAAAIIDLDGKVLAAARWQRACTGFHRANPASCERCIESDTELALQLQDGENYTLYRCKNGMTDAAAPIIVEGQHLANVFIGQFHLRQPDMDFFRAQAAQFNYPEADYLAAVRAAPVMEEHRLPTILNFLSGFARMISTMSLARRRADAAQVTLEEQAAMLRRERVAALSIAEDAERARKLLVQAGNGVES